MIQDIHERALEVSGRYKRAEADLISILQELEETKAYREKGCTSLFSYALKVLGLSESVCSNCITVARKAKIAPLLLEAIEAGTLGVSKARKITPVLTRENQAEWVDKALTLSTRKLEQEVARVAPKEAAPERMKFVSEERLELRLGISKEFQDDLKRAQDLESQRTKRAVSLEETLQAALHVYLEAKDPVRKAERILKKPLTQVHVSRGHVAAQTKHQVTARDGGQCVYVDAQGVRCENRRWLDVHHIQPRSEGGSHALSNLQTLCSAHHRMEHEI